MKWYIPSFYGDFRLEQHEGTLQSKLVIENATPVELEYLERFFKIAHQKKWIEDKVQIDNSFNVNEVILAAPVDKTGPTLVRVTKPKRTTLTAVKHKNGVIETTSQSGSLDSFAKKAFEKKADAAASVSRPTPCCPDCELGEIKPAGEVLRAFMSETQHRDWAKHRAIVVEGGLSGFRYLIAHRHSPQAVQQRRICYDLDNNLVIHFHDNTVPPEEEVLAAKLILEHREHWLRNEATTFGNVVKFKNPFGDSSDGLSDSAFTRTIGEGMMKLLG